MLLPAKYGDRPMRNMISAIATIITIGTIATAGHPSSAASVDLITQQEAALPDAVGVNIQLGLRGVSRGPKIQVLAPAPDAGQVRSPLHLLLKFDAFGGSMIDPRSVRLTYLKKPAINLTPRISDWINAGGIEIPSAEIPPGTHYLKIEVKDTAGRQVSTIFAVMVEN
jgi:hypothetical protein